MNKGGSFAKDALTLGQASNGSDKNESVFVTF